MANAQAAGLTTHSATEIPTISSLDIAPNSEQDVEFLRRLGALEEGYTSVNEAERERAETLERIADAQERANAIAEEAAAAQKEIDEALKSFGITVKDTNAEIAALETFLIDLEDKFRDGKVEAERYDLTVAAVQEKLAKLRGDAEDVVPALSAVEQGFSSLAGSTDAAAEGAETVSKSFERLSSGEFFQGIKDLVRGINELTTAFENAGLAASLINLGGGGGGGGVVGGVGEGEEGGCATKKQVGRQHKDRKQSRNSSRRDFPGDLCLSLLFTRVILSPPHLGSVRLQHRCRSA